MEPYALVNPALVGGRRTPVNMDIYAAAAQPAAPPDDDGSSSSRPPPQPWPKLVLDSGASIYVVGDSRLLSNLRDAPVGMTVRVANGNTLPVTKIGDIQMIAAGFTIPDVHLAPGLKSLTYICTFFDGDRAVLYAGPDLVGEAVAPKEQKNGLYVLQFLRVPEIAATASGNCLDGEMKLVWHGSSARAPLPEMKHFARSQFSQIVVVRTRAVPVKSEALYETKK